MNLDYSEMPLDIWCDLLEDQGEDVSELRLFLETGMVINGYHTMHGSSFGNGNDDGNGFGCGHGYGDGFGFGCGYSYGSGYGYDHAHGVARGDANTERTGYGSP